MNLYNYQHLNSISVDIIMPNYNKDKFIKYSINSVISQTFSNWNLFIIDDNSNDQSKKIIKSFDNNKIKKIYLPKNKGVAFCRNLGIRLSKSKYITFLDSDDYWTSNKLEEQIFFMDKNNYDFTYTNYTPFFLEKNDKILKKEIILPKYFNYEKFLNNTSIIMSSMILKRSIIGLKKFPKVKICEDYAFKCKILKSGIIATKLNKNLTFYQISKNSLQSNNLRNVYWVWHINKKYNRLTFFKNLKSLIFIIISSIRRYGNK